jgi:hypothetical protein
MSRRPTTFRQRDLTAAVKGVVAAGCAVMRVEIDPMSGKIIVTVTAGSIAEPMTDLDKWMARHSD